MEVHTPTLPVRSHTNLRVYRHAEALYNDLFWITRGFPRMEHFALTNQLRSTARSIRTSIRTGWINRYNPAAFKHCLDDAQSACARLNLWLGIACQCTYLTPTERRLLRRRTRHIQRMLTRLHAHRITLLA